VLSAFGSGTMAFPSSDQLRSGFAGFHGGNIYLASAIVSRWLGRYAPHDRYGQLGCRWR
jgi:hypothetical protein